MEKVDNYERPICANIGCGKPAEGSGITASGRRTWETLCSACNRGPNKARKGVTPIKKDYCENQDGRLGFKCTATITSLVQLDMDHIDGDRYNNVPENIQTICKNCHALKSINERNLSKRY